MSRSNLTAASVAAVSLEFAAPALADDSYPRAVGGGEDTSIEYGPGPARDIVGGGRMVVRQLADGETEVGYLDDDLLQPPRMGKRPVLVGSGDDA